MRCVTYVAIFVIVSPAALGELEARAAETPNPGTVPEWVRELPENVLTWFETVQHVPQTPEDPWGLFTFSRDSTVPYCVYSTAAAWAIADTCGGNEKLPGYTPDARRQMALIGVPFYPPLRERILLTNAREARPNPITVTVAGSGTGTAGMNGSDRLVPYWNPCTSMLFRSKVPV